MGRGVIDYGGPRKGGSEWMDLQKGVSVGITPRAFLFGWVFCAMAVG